MGYYRKIVSKGGVIMSFWKAFKIVKKILDIVGDVEELGGQGDEKKELAVEIIKQKEENLSTEKAGEVIKGVISLINLLEVKCDETNS